MPKTLAISYVEIQNFGPFSVPTRLELAPAVTVLTGSNDVGKTLLLRAIYYTFSEKKAEEREVNQERRNKFPGAWNADTEVQCNFRLVVTRDAIDRRIVAGQLIENDELECLRRLNKNEAIAIRQVRRGSGIIQVASNLPKPPQAISLQPSEVRNLLPIAELNEDELRLLRLGFGEAFPKNFAATRDEQRIQICSAEAALNGRLREIVPASLGLQFKLNDVGGVGKELDLGIVDALNSYVPVKSRGAGVRKILSLMGSLLSLSNLSAPILVLIDEPENSLHADAQHALRRLLERIAESSLVQIVYATHSPSMINPMRPEAIRVLERSLNSEQKPTTVIHNQAFKDGFLHVRSSLGLTPADSLLYAQVTVVVEGDTEVLCIGTVLQKLASGGVDGFADIKDLLPEICVVDGMGFNFSHVCHLAKLHKANPVVFLDGDMQNHKAVAKLKGQHPDVPVLFINESREFEQVVPKNVYIDALVKELEADPQTINVAAFEEWLRRGQGFGELAFSKQIEIWIGQSIHQRVHKSQIMYRAITDVAPKNIDAEPFRRLLEEIRRLLKVQ